MNIGDKVYLVRYGTFNVTVATFLGEETLHGMYDHSDTYYKTNKGNFKLGYEEYSAYNSPQEIIDLFERTELARAVDKLKQARTKLKELKGLGKGLVA
jgi:hypothetical protein